MNVTLTPLEERIDEAFFCVDGVFVRRIRLEGKQVILPQHYHVHDHNTLVAHGAVRVYVSKKKHDELEPDEFPDLQLIGDFSADDNDMIFIEAGRHHQFVTLTEKVKLCCLHYTHGEDAEVIMAQAPSLFKE